MSMNNKLYIQVCIDFKNRQVYVDTFSDDGKKVYEKMFNNIEFIELSGVLRILVGEHMISNIVCLNLESSNAKIIQQGLMLKIG